MGSDAQSAGSDQVRSGGGQARQLGLRAPGLSEPEAREPNVRTQGAEEAGLARG
jgi:hypothetical protein